MSQTKAKTQDSKGRVRLGTLPKQEKEIKSREGENVKGGGGAGGGVLGSRNPDGSVSGTTDNQRR